MLALKLTLVPLFLLLVSMSGRWWGPSIAGWLAGLPVVAGPILLLVAVEHGPAFGAQAALLSLSAIAASEAFNFAYAWTCRQRRWPARARGRPRRLGRRRERAREAARNAACRDGRRLSLIHI